MSPKGKVCRITSPLLQCNSSKNTLAPFQLLNEETKKSRSACPQGQG